MTAEWVCPECGLDYGTVNRLDAAVALQSFPRRYAEVLTPLADTPDGDRRLRRRPDPATWSAIEYAAHVADVLRDLAGTVERMVREDHPTFGPGFDPDARAESEGYGTRPLDRVLADLDAASATMRAALDRVGDDGWERLGSFPFGERDVLAIVRNAVHEGSHHLRDVQRVLAAR